ncbi:hypothetical protein Trydic_g16792 [Trypoxylus dichotomus]
MHNSGTRYLLLGTAYLPYDQEDPPPTSEVKTLMSYAGVHKLQLLFGCDANTHHTIWGSRDTNKRGESLFSHLVANGLVTLNRENKPTFVPALGRLPLHENQYAYQSGKSCEQAIHELARRAEIVFRHKEIALVTFLDIKGTFDRASFMSMERPLQKRGVKPTLTRWITSMLNNRSAHVSRNLCNIGATVAADCPQGGVLSPLLWCLLVDDLLSDLRRAGFYTQGYADDITFMVSGRFEGVVSERMQVALRLVETWCRNEG